MCLGVPRGCKQLLVKGLLVQMNSLLARFTAAWSAKPLFYFEIKYCLNIEVIWSSLYTPNIFPRLPVLSKCSFIYYQYDGCLVYIGAYSYELNQPHRYHRDTGFIETQPSAAQLVFPHDRTEWKRDEIH